MKRWQKRIPPYEGEEPYLYLAFAEADSGRVYPLARALCERGCRVWYCVGPSGSAEELLRRQKRSGGAALTALYLSDAACRDQDTKSNVLFNQNLDRPILCLDPDDTDRRLSMGLREDVPHVPLYSLSGKEERESAILHAEGFSQEMLGEPVKIRGGGAVRTLTAALCALAVLLGAAAFLLARAGGRAEAEVPGDEVTFSDPLLLAAAREAAGGGALTREAAEGITFLRLEGLPESWEGLEALPALEGVQIPQTALRAGGALPEGLTVTLSGGGA